METSWGPSSAGRETGGNSVSPATVVGGGPGVGTGVTVGTAVRVGDAGVGASGALPAAAGVVGGEERRRHRAGGEGRDYRATAGGHYWAVTPPSITTSAPVT